MEKKTENSITRAIGDSRPSLASIQCPVDPATVCVVQPLSIAGINDHDANRSESSGIDPIVYSFPVLTTVCGLVDTSQENTCVKHARVLRINHECVNCQGSQQREHFLTFV
jgi:hypothetical protein